MLFITTPVIAYEDLPVDWTEVSNGYTHYNSGCSSLLHNFRSWQYISASVSFFPSTHIWQILCGYSSIDTPRLMRQLRSGSFYQVRTEYTCGQLYMYIQGNTDEIQRPAHWNMISRNMPAQPPVLSPRSIPTLLSFQYAFIPAKKKLGVTFKNIFISLFIYFFNFVSLKLCTLKLRSQWP